MNGEKHPKGDMRCRIRNFKKKKFREMEGVYQGKLVSDTYDEFIAGTLFIDRKLERYILPFGYPEDKKYHVERDTVEEYRGACIKRADEDGNAALIPDWRWPQEPRLKPLSFEEKVRLINESAGFLSRIAQTPEICLEAVKSKGYALQFVREQTPDICLAAVAQKGLALQFVQEQAPDICLAAVRQNGKALQFVKGQTSEICLEAVKQDGHALQFVQEQTSEICLAAVAQKGIALQFVQEQISEICLAAVAQKGLALKYVQTQTPEICAAAMRQNPNAKNFVRGQPAQAALAG